MISHSPDSIQSINTQNYNSYASDSLDKQLVEAFSSGNYSEAANLIREGADCQQLVKLDKALFIDFFTERLNLFEIQNNPRFRRTDDFFEKMRFFLEQVLDNGLTLNSDDFYNALPEEFQSDESLLESFEILLPTMAFMQNLPLPIVAIFKGEEEVVDAALEQGVNFNTLKATYTLPHESAGYLGVKDIDVDFTLTELQQLLNIALDSKNNKAADLLLKFGLDPVSLFQSSPLLLDFALKAGHYETVKAILDYEPKLADEKHSLEEQKRIEEHVKQLRAERGMSRPYFSMQRFDYYTNVYNSKMSLAAQGGNVEIMQMLLDRGDSVTAKDYSDFQSSIPLLEALKYGNIEAAQFLIDHGAQFDPTLRDNQSGEIFRYVAKFGNPKALEFLFDLGVTLSAPIDEYDCDPIPLLIMGKNEANIRYALSLDSSRINEAAAYMITWDEPRFIPDIPTKSYKPLTHIEMIDLFVEFGANLEDYGYIALGQAFRGRLLDEINYLLDLGVKPNKELDLYEEATSVIILFGTLYEPELLNKVVEMGIDIQSILEQDEWNNFIVEYTCRFSEYATFEHLANRENLQKLKNLGLRFDFIDPDTNTNLLFWTSSEAIPFLLEEGLDINQVDVNGNTPIMHAFEECFDLLISHGANIHTQNNRGETLLHTLLLTTDYFKKAIDLGLDPNHENLEGLTPLMALALWSADSFFEKSWGDRNLSEYIEKCELDISYVNKNGKTALDVLVEEHQDRISDESFWNESSILKENLLALGYQRP